MRRGGWWIGAALVPLSAVVLPQVPVAAADQAVPISSTKRTGDPDLAKLDSSLLAVLDATSARTEPSDGPIVATSDLDEELVPLDLTVDLGPGVEAQLRKAGLIIDGAYPEWNRVSGRAPISALRAIAELDAVAVIQREYGAVTNVGSTDNQADAAMLADIARSTSGVNGTGVNIGILSDSFNQTLGGTATGTGCGRTVTGMSNQVSGDLPTSVTVLDDLVGGSDEGAAMAELIHDVAPGAALSFTTAFGGQAVFADGITALAACGADVIVDDVSYFAEPMFQDGVIAQAAQAAVDAGVAYFSSAGNQATFGVDEMYVDVDPVPDTGTSLDNNLHRFGTDGVATVSIPGNSTVRFILQWNEPFSSGTGTGASTDYDLYLGLDAALTNIVASGETGQGCGLTASPGGNPLEIVQVTNNSASAVPAFLGVNRFCGAPTPDLGGRFRIAVYASTAFSGEAGVFDKNQIYGHSAAAGAVAVAAMDFCEIETNGAFRGTPTVFDVESFSSLGGEVPIYFDPTGAPLAGGPLTRPKPELTAPDGSNTSFFGSNRNDPPSGCDFNDGSPNFFGTSAAAPHAAAVAALMLERQPGLTPAEVTTILTGTAIDAESPGFDAFSGAGFVDAASAVLAADPAARPAVALVPASGQPNPTATSPVRFTATFSEPVEGLVGADVLIGGTAGATTAVVTGGPSVYTISAAVPTGPRRGTVTAHIPANAATSISTSLGNLGSPTATVTYDNVASAFSTLPQTRLYDTRDPGRTKLAAGSTTRFQIAGLGDVPSDASAAVINVTVAGTEANGFVTVAPCGATVPTTSSLNYTAGVNIANEVVARLDANGGVCVTTSARTHLILDVVGYVDPDSPTRPTAPERFLDTRTTTGPVAAGSTTRIRIAGRGDIPTGARSAIVNVAAVRPDQSGFLTVHPCLATRPTASSLNYTAGVNRANDVLASLSASGDICVFSSVATNLLIDVSGFLPADSGLEGTGPSRLLDTRASAILTAGQIVRVQVAGRFGVAPDATSAVLNIAAVRPVGSGFVTAYPCTPTVPNASILNYVAGVNGANETIAPLSATGELCLFTSNATHLLVDVSGYQT